MEDVLRFAAFSSSIDPGLWHALAKRKLDSDRLGVSWTRLTAGYSSCGRRSQTTQQQLPLLFLDAGSFGESTGPLMSSSGGLHVQGSLLNTNTLEDFKALDKSAILSDLTAEIWKDIESGAALENPGSLTRFALIGFSDLKKYKFYYWLCVPALMPREPFLLGNFPKQLNDVFTPADIEQLQSRSSLEDPFFLLKKHKNGIQIAHVKDWMTFFEFVPEEERMVGFLDPSTLPQNPGWPLRNFLLLLKRQFQITKVSVLCLRRTLTEALQIDSSIILNVVLPGGWEVGVMPKSVGWEKTFAGKLAPRMADLGSVMDPQRLAETAVDLNLKLMKWRALPSIDLDKIAGRKCLLFGAGTLGCYTARALMAWGIRHITFVDNGRVSFSNPVRQPLFDFEDCLEGGKPKAFAAANRLRDIFPGMTANGIDLSIPMPCHPLTDSEATRSTFKQIEDLVEAHDVLFLLTDTRESRWLPSLLGAAKGKIVMNAALGFDSFLVMRHGMKSLGEQGQKEEDVKRLGCYFCNDVVGPKDSLKDRTLDQQCTVTRPGLSLLASSLAVELMVSLVSHPDGPRAPPQTNLHPSEPIEHPFGLVPHQIRGFLTHFTNLLVTGQAFDKCTACSTKVVEAYEKGGYEFLLNAINDDKFLETVTGLTEMFAETQDVDVEWDEEGAELDE